MSNFNKFLIPSFILIGIVPSLNSTRNGLRSDSNVSYTSARTITENDKINVINKEISNNSSYDYTSGVSTYSPVGEVKPKEIENKNYESPNMYTHNEVQEIVDNISNEYSQSLKITVSDYDKYIKNTIDEYEKYINLLNDEYKALENAYVDALNIIDYYDKNFTDNNRSSSNKNTKESNINENISSNNLDLIYDEARKKASENLENFQPIQGQIDSKNLESSESTKGQTDSKKLETHDSTKGQTDSKKLENPNYTQEENKEINENTQNNNINDKFVDSNINDTSTGNTDELTSNEILEFIKSGIDIPNYSEHDENFLSQKYGIQKNNISDYKLITSGNNAENYFEMLIIKVSDINEDSLLNSIELRIDSILKEYFENTNEKDINNNILLVDIDDYVVFSFSNISQQILNFLSNT